LIVCGCVKQKLCKFKVSNFIDMKTFIVILCCALSFQFSLAQSYSEKDLEEIKQYLEAFSEAAIAKDTTLLKSYIFTSESNPTEDFQEYTIKFILLNNENAQRDFAYSHKALQIVIEKEIHQFKPITEEIYMMLAEQPDGIFSEATKDLLYKEIPIFDVKNAHIILVRRDNKYQLIFWESLNNLLAP